MDNDNITNLNWDSRILCSDESCIGVIGQDGRCKECGKLYEGEPPWKDANAGVRNGVESESLSNSHQEPPTSDSETAAADSSDGKDDEDWEQRVLCPDETCIGVIGPDGRCKECGRPIEQ